MTKTECTWNEIKTSNQKIMNRIWLEREREKLRKRLSYLKKCFIGHEEEKMGILIFMECIVFSLHFQITLISLCLSNESLHNVLYSKKTGVVYILYMNVNYFFVHYCILKFEHSQLYNKLCQKMVKVGISLTGFGMLLRTYWHV